MAEFLLILFCIGSLVWYLTREPSLEHQKSMLDCGYRWNRQTRKFEEIELSVETERHSLIERSVVTLADCIEGKQLYCINEEEFAKNTSMEFHQIKMLLSNPIIIEHVGRDCVNIELPKESMTNVRGFRLVIRERDLKYFRQDF